MHTPLLLAFAGALAASGAVAVPAPPVVVRQGWDWSLPEGTQSAPYSGFVTWGPKRYHPSITVSGLHIRWKDLNPEPDVYRWDLLRERIAANRAAGMRTGIHLMGVERPGVPDWVIERCKPPVIDVPVLQENQPWRLQTVPPWIPAVDEAFLRFLAAFAETGIARSEDVVYGYIHGISASRGEELFLRPQDIEIYERESGLTPEVLTSWIRRRVDAMLAAFKGAEGKLAWMTGGAFAWRPESYREATADVWRYAIERGTGIRGGGIDFQHVLYEEPAWGSRLDEEGYALVDDTHPTIAEGRFRGDENEEYGKYWEWRFGPAEQYDYRHRICSLRGLQVRQNFQMVSAATLELNPELNDYVRLTQGRRREDSPDAWAYLRECSIRPWRQPRKVKNIERWLVQRDVEGSRSVPSERIDRPPLVGEPKEWAHDFDARRTDCANGQDGLAFQLDRVFWPKPAPAVVKVTYTDRAPAAWHLETTGAAGGPVRSASVTNAGDGERKTATFTVAELAGRGALPGGMDFRVVTEGPGDLMVTMVRVLREPIGGRQPAFAPECRDASELLPECRRKPAFSGVAPVHTGTPTVAVRSGKGVREMPSRWWIAVVAGLVAWSTAPGTAAPATWEVRRAHVADQTEEWSKEGKLPAWDVKLGEGEWPEVAIGGDEKGLFRGTVLVGRKWRVPDPLPAGLRLRLEYQTFCAMNDPRPRSGIPRLLFLTPEAWARIATDPARAEKLDLSPQTEGIVAAYSIHAGNDDVTEWRAWESPDLARLLSDRKGRELVLALAWSAMHFDEEWAKFRGVEVVTVTQEEMDRRVLEALDLERPELAAVKAALARDDVPGAKAAIAAHLRTRAKPVGRPLSPDGSARGIQAADEILTHTFRFVGCPPTKLGEKILWNEDPHQYDQWAIALNRHTHWVTLGRAYAATRDEKYAREFVAQLNDWVESMPVYIGPRWIQGPFFETRKAPLTLDAGIRMAQSWWQSYNYFKDSPAFDAESQFRMLRSLYDHALYLMAPQGFHPSSNWGAMEVAGLLTVAVMLPEFKDAPAWLKTARERLVEAQKAQVYPDGAQIELTPGYHSVTLGNFLMALDVTRRNGIELPAEFVAGLEKMFEYYVAISMPDGRAPAMNDSGWGPGGRGAAQALPLFPTRRDFEFMATNGAKGTPPERTSWALPYAGWYVMRTGWGQDDLYLHLDAGPYGAGHQHEDKLSILAHAGRKTILTEPGNYSYDTSDWRRYVLSTRGHNTVMVDGLEQNHRTHPETHVVWEPAPCRWVSDAGFDHAEGTYDLGYGPKNEVKVAHTRQVVFAKPDYWLVVDTMVPADEKEHRYEALFHLDAEDAVVDPATVSVTVTYGDNAFRVLPLRTEGVEVEIVKGQKEPVIQGWLPTGQHNVLRPIPTAVVRWRATGPSVMAYALVPRKPGGEWPVIAARALPAGVGELAAELTGPSGKDILLRRPAGGAAAAAGPVQTDAELAVARLDARGKLTRSLIVGGKELSLPE